MKILTLISVYTLFFTNMALAKPIRVAVIDTGAPITMIQPCKEGHKDFTGLGLQDTHGHGSNISSIIDTYASGADYCQIYLKYYGSGKSFNMRSSLDAFRRAIDLKVDIINYSSGGKEYSSEEAQLVKEALDKGIFIIAAAGNEKMDFSKTGCKYYPACLDPRIVVVGCKHNNKLCSMSNDGEGIDIFADGYKVTAGGNTLTGTSQATAIVTGRFIKFWDAKRKYEKDSDL